MAPSVTQVYGFVATFSLAPRPSTRAASRKCSGEKLDGALPQWRGGYSSQALQVSHAPVTPQGQAYSLFAPMYTHVGKPLFYAEIVLGLSVTINYQCAFPCTTIAECNRRDLALLPTGLVLVGVDPEEAGGKI
jgi:hypothetical protein